jgi:hypothetical protein
MTAGPAFRSAAIKFNSVPNPVKSLRKIKPGIDTVPGTGLPSASTGPPKTTIDNGVPEKAFEGDSK